MDIKPFLEADPAIQLHMVFAVFALVLGGLILWRRKGTPRHKFAGRVWVVSMMVVSFSGFFIHEIRLWGDFSPIHIFSIVVPVFLTYAIRAALKGNIDEHRRTMQATYLGGMLIAGGFTFLPGRMNNDIFFGESNIDVFESAGFLLFPLVAVLLIALVFSRTSRKV